ncbi:interleukin-15-like [Garra rufa]|uniref:interleukin-15-like n=1 Tax=Garra rufa TaxID=137080 RepID=UPI003CCEC405
MFALHWICALTLALVICLSAQPVKRNAGNYILDDLKELNETLQKIQCPDSIRLYSPSDIREDCMSSAVNCIISELSVLKDECGIKDNDNNEDEDAAAFDNLIYDLNQTLLKKWNIPAISSQDCSCEMYDEKDVIQFVDDIEKQVQLLNVM